ncbi:hypothetical protein AgCh_004974 [Apium graveolens]
MPKLKLESKRSSMHYNLLLLRKGSIQSLAIVSHQDGYDLLSEQGFQIGSPDTTCETIIEEATEEENAGEWK